MSGTLSRGREGGFVLVTSLLVLVLLAGFGAGAFFLTNMNLRIAENTRTSAIAQYNAHEGLDVALLILAKEFYERGDGTWPTFSELQARTPPGAEYEFLAFDLDPVNADGLHEAGTVTVRGIGPRQARYETGARFRGEVTSVEVDSDADPLFGTGWVTDAEIQINGNTSFSIPLWAGESLTANATKVLGTVGNFANSGFIGATPANCTIHGKSAVTCNRGQTPPVVPTFNFEAGALDIRDEAPAGCNYTVAAGVTASLSASLHQNKTICLGENANLTLTGTASNTFVIGPRTSSVDLRASSLAYGGAPDGIGMKIAAGTIILGTNVDMAGSNTLFSAYDVLVDKIGAATFGTGTIGTLIATEQDVSFQSVKGTLNAIIWTNASVCKIGGGGLSFTGTILAGGNDLGSGHLCSGRNDGIYWNGGGGGTFTGVSNSNIPDTGGDDNNPFAAAGIRVLARRP